MPVILDLFCGGGGAAKGYHDAGFDIIGVDINPQPSYPFEFHQMDFRDALERFKGRVDAVHASPPCQFYLKGFKNLNKKRSNSNTSSYPDFVPIVQKLLEDYGVPFVIENVVGAPLQNTIQLCGSSFGLPLRRHRIFQCSFPIPPKPCDHSWQTEKKYPSNFRAKDGTYTRLSSVVQVYGVGSKANYANWPMAMGIDWLSPSELTQAIPPAYTKYIGDFLLEHIRNTDGSTLLY